MLSPWPQNDVTEPQNEDWYNIGGAATHHQDLSFSPNNNHLLLPPADSSASCSPSPSVFNNPNQVDYLINNPLQTTPLDLGFDFETALNSFDELGVHAHGHLNPISNPPLSNMDIGYAGPLGVLEGGPFFNRPKILKPLDQSGSSQPTLFQKRAALRKNLGGNLGNLSLDKNHNVEGFEFDVSERKRKGSSGDDVEDLSLDGSNLNYDSSDDQFLENGGGASKGEVEGSDRKGKKKGLPAKNLMAERRRRKKLNDRLYMLRSVVPKISKMDRASILGDAVDYLKELLQKINDLNHNVIPNMSPTTNTSFYPLTPTTPGLPSRMKEELCPSAFASPLSSPSGHPARVEVRLREGRAVNIHMLCGRKPGILVSTLRAMDDLGLDIQQAVISCFNGFALDVFRAEQWGEGQEINPDQIKAVLLDSAGFHGMH